MDVENEIKALKLLQKQSAKKERSLLFMVAKPFLLFLLPLLLVLSVFPGVDGKPMLDWQAAWDKVSGFDVKQSLSNVDKALELPGQTTTVKVYRYKDANGQWVFSSEAPADSAQAEELSITTQINTLAPMPVADGETTNSKANGLLPTIEGVTPTNVLQKAKELQAVANERNQALQQF